MLMVPNRLRGAFAPIVATSFVNKCGSIGLSLLPMLLVARGVETTSASVVIAIAKSSSLIGLWLGGWLCDRQPTRRVILASLVIASLGLGAMPFTTALAMLAVAGFVANLGNSLFMTPVRLMLSEVLPPSKQRVGFGWLRTANNAGGIVSFSIGALSTAWGLTALILFDAATSLIAAVWAAATLPKGRTSTWLADEAARAMPETPPISIEPVALASKANVPFAGAKSLFLICSAMLAGYGMLYESFMTGMAGRCRVLLGEEGLRVFSAAMVLNTVLCALFAVAASRKFERSALTFPIGIGLTALGAALATGLDASKPAIFAGAFVVTLGEIVFTTMGQYILVRLAPDVGTLGFSGKKAAAAPPPGSTKGSLYGLAMLTNGVGRVAGGALAFPLVVTAPMPWLYFAVLGVILVVGALWAAKDLRRFDAGETRL